MIYAIIFLVSLIGSFATGWETHKWKTDSEALKAVKVEYKVEDTAAMAHEVFREKERIKYVNVYKNVDRIVKEPFYLDSNACLNDDGLRAVADAIGTAASQSSPEMPSPSSPK